MTEETDSPDPAGRKKTFKRELAALQLLIWWAMVFYALYSIGHHTAETSAAVVALTLAVALYVWAFAFAAFGVDTVYKQVIPSLGK